MKNIIIFCVLSFLALPVMAEFSLDDLDLSLDDFSLEKITDLKGWTPRYTYVVDDNLIGKTHYLGLSYFKRQGEIHEGPTLKVGFGDRGEKINLSYTSGFSFMSVDMGLSYLLPDQDNPRNFDQEIEGLGIELGLRFWVVQFIGIHTEDTSYISLGYGF